MNFKELADKVNATTVEIKNVTEDIKISILVVNEQHQHRVRTK